MAYTALARTWRPKKFAELVGQEHVRRALTNALESGRVHHAFLFTGTRGVGKTTIARIFAKCLNCETGVTASPCGVCGACREIDSGRFVDLIEVDAATNTKVDETRELLDNVQYAPTRGRYKVYLIDEVHMLSTHSFNAMLKTLEEPPPHVKFLLATTDPQKLPVTVLSRCLQFNLKRLPVAQITERMREILEKEGVAFEPAGLRLIAQAADGSLRDGLSLLDQLIAFGGGKAGEAEARAMLGTIARDHVVRLADLLGAMDVPELLSCARSLEEFAPDYAQVLDELASLFVRIAMKQAVSEFEGDELYDPEVLARLAKAIAPEDVQLFYQTAITGRRDLGLAPDPRSGFEMTLLRMIAFRPLGEAEQVRGAASVAGAGTGGGAAAARSAAGGGGAVGGPAAASGGATASGGSAASGSPSAPGDAPLSGAAAARAAAAAAARGGGTGGTSRPTSPAAPGGGSSPRSGGAALAGGVAAGGVSSVRAPAGDAGSSSALGGGSPFGAETGSGAGVTAGGSPGVGANSGAAAGRGPNGGGASGDRAAAGRGPNGGGASGDRAATGRGPDGGGASGDRAATGRGPDGGGASGDRAAIGRGPDGGGVSGDRAATGRGPDGGGVSGDRAATGRGPDGGGVSGDRAATGRGPDSGGASGDRAVTGRGPVGGGADDGEYGTGRGPAGANAAAGDALGGGADKTVAGSAKRGVAGGGVNSGGAVISGSPAAASGADIGGEPWSTLIGRLELGGAARQLASNCQVLSRQGAVLRLALDARNKHMRTPAQEDKLTQALSRYLGQPIRLEFETTATGIETPALAEQRASLEDLEAARRAFESDPGVQGLRERFGATLLPETVRPVK